MTDLPEQDGPPITELSAAQRRVLGVLVEKGLTTPDAYPLTLKAVATGCNQKSNRDPLTDYSEDDVLETLDQLRELGLIAERHTESGRTARYRHFVRHRFKFTEPQLAIITELLLRGRQSLGELRSRASRMVAIDSLEQLRDELSGLQDMGLVQANGPLDRRGVEVDHTLYRRNERRPMAPVAAEPTPAERLPVAAANAPVPAAQGESSRRLATLEETVGQLQQENRRLREELDALHQQFAALSDRLDEFRQALGG
jgi:uncharacterized protein YceH (UPF0502 family)